MTLKIIFMGTPEFAVPTLNAIIEHRHDVVGVYTQPPRPAGRGTKLRKSPVHEFALKAGLNIKTPKSLKNTEQHDIFKALGADVAVVIAYGLILPKPILEAPEFGCLNIHASLLPRWRGAAPIQRAIMAGDKKTGIMIQQMDEGLDTGDILLVEEMDITDEMTAGELHDAMMHKSSTLIIKTLNKMQAGDLNPVPQREDGVKYAEKISKTESEINWQQPAISIHNHIRGLSPYPGAWTAINWGGNHERLKILRSKPASAINSKVEITDATLKVQCGDGALSLLEVQRQGKRPLAIKEFLNGLPSDFKFAAL